MKSKIFVVVSILLLLPVLVWSNAWYVSTVGNNANSGINPVTAWRDISYAVNTSVVLAGDTILVAAGTYTENVPISKPLTFLGPNVGIDGNSGGRNPEAIIKPIVGDPEQGRIFDLQTSNVVIDGFTLDGNNSAVTSGYSYAVGTADVYTSAGVSNGDPYNAPSAAYQVDHFTFQNNIVKNISYQGIYYQVAYTSNHSWNYILHNKFDTMWEGIQIYALHADISNNTFVEVNRGLSTHSVNAAADIGFTPQITNNTISIATAPSYAYTVSNTGIWVNFRSLNAPALNVSNNTISFPSGIPLDTPNQGLIIYTITGGRTVSFNNNIVNGNNVCNLGIKAWLCDSTSNVSVNGGAFNDIKDYGVFATNSTGFGWGDVYLKINNLPITMNAGGIGVRTYVENTTGGAVPLNNENIDINQGTSITGGATGIDANDGIVNIQNSSVYSNATGVVVSNTGSILIHHVNLGGNSNYGINNTTASAVTASYNWWGDASGPTPVGSGDTVSANVVYAPWSETTVDINTQAISDSVNTTVSFGTAGVDMDFSLGTSGTGGTASIGLAHTAPGGANVVPSKSIKRVWNISSDLSNFTTNVILNYQVSDIPIGVDETQLTALRSTDYGATWQIVPNIITVDTGTHSVTVNDVTGFSYWALSQQDSAPTLTSLPALKLFMDQSITDAFDLNDFNSGGVASSYTIPVNFLSLSSLSNSSVSEASYGTATSGTNTYQLDNLFGTSSADNKVKYSTYKIQKLPKVGLTEGASWDVNVANYTIDSTGSALPASFGDDNSLIISDPSKVTATWVNTSTVRVTSLGVFTGAESVDVIAAPVVGPSFGTDLDKERISIYSNLLSNGTFSTSNDTSFWGIETAPGKTSTGIQIWLPSFTDGAGTQANGIWSFTFANAQSGVKITPFASNYISVSSSQWYIVRMRLVATGSNQGQSILFGFGNQIGAGIQTDVSAYLFSEIPNVWTWQEAPLLIHTASSTAYPQFQLKATSASAVYIDEIQIIEAAPTLVDVNRSVNRLKYPYGDFDVASDTTGWGQEIYTSAIASPGISVNNGLLLDFSGASTFPNQQGLKWTANNAVPGTVYTPDVTPGREIGTKMSFSTLSGSFNSVGIVLVAGYGVLTSGQPNIGSFPSDLIAAAEIGSLADGIVETVGTSVNGFYQFQFGFRSDVPGIIKVNSVDFLRDNDDPNFGDPNLFP